MSQSFRRRVYELVDVPLTEDGTRARLDWFDLSIGVLIVLNVAAVMLETVEPLHRRYLWLFDGFETVSVAVFTVEYVLRLWSCTADPAYRHPVWGRLRFATRPMAVVDLLAILPSYIPNAWIDFRFLRVLRLLRLLRVLKLGRYSDAVAVLAATVRSKRAELGVMLLILAMLLVLSSGVMYYAEHEAQPQHFSSMPAALWWSVITLTTIGYGDVYPVTPIGRVLGGLIAISGIGFVALPTAIMASGFADELKARRKPDATCPHCGKPLPPPG